jgi:antitoxin HicB
MVRYPVILERDDNDTILVSFPDFPEAHTFGDTREEALTRAKDALATVIDLYIGSRRPLPTPSKGRELVQLPALMGVKVDLYNAMTSAGVSKAELGRRLQVHPPQVDRLLDLKHGTRMELLEAAAEAVGATLVVTIGSEMTARPRRRSLLPRPRGTSRPGRRAPKAIR